MLKEVIVLQDMAIMEGIAYYIRARNSNGTVIAETGGNPMTAIAAFMPAVMKHRHTLRPEVGIFVERNRPDGSGMVYPLGIRDCTVEDWRRAVRAVPRLQWHRVLKGKATSPETVKVTLVNWSPDDVSKIHALQWFVGFSATAPLLRLYMLVPRPVWESDPDAAEMPVFDGQVHQVQRWGSIMAPSNDGHRWR